MNRKIKVFIVIAAVLACLLLSLNLVLNSHLRKNTYDSYMSLESIYEDRTKYVHDIFKKISAKQYEEVYASLTKECKESFNNNLQNLKAYIDSAILLSDEITNTYGVAVIDISEVENIIVTLQVIITPSDIQLAKEILKKSKVVRPIYVDIVEMGPGDYKINKIYEKEA